MLLQGDLKDFSASQICNLINLAKKTGTLTLFANMASGVEAPQTPNQDSIYQATRIVFFEGDLIHIETHDLITLLYTSGKLTARQTQWVRERAAGLHQKALGLRLVDWGFARQSDVMDILHEQMLDTLHTAMTWTEGSFLFEAELPSFEEIILMPINMLKVLREHGIRMREIKRLTLELPNLDAQMAFTHNAEHRLAGTQLSKTMWRVASSIRENVSIRKIAQQNHMSETEIRRVVLELRELGLVNIETTAYVESAPLPDTRVATMDTLIESIQNAAAKLLGRSDYGSASTSRYAAAGH